MSAVETVVRSRCWQGEGFTVVVKLGCWQVRGLLGQRIHCCFRGQDVSRYEAWLGDGFSFSSMQRVDRHHTGIRTSHEFCGLEGPRDN